jgi:hypothetical protein
MFHYTSVQSHGMITPEGKKIKETRVHVNNGKGIKKVTVTDENGSHSDVQPLKKSEIKNIKEHKFMPRLFHVSLKNVMRKKNSQTRRSNKKGTKSKK